MIGLFYCAYNLIDYAFTKKMTQDLIYCKFRSFPVNRLAESIKTLPEKFCHTSLAGVVINHKKKDPMDSKSTGQIFGLPVEILFPESDEILHTKEEKRKKQQCNNLDS
jgi:hypothetical protein